MSQKAIVLDANILIGAVLGKRARELILEHAATVQFIAPDAAGDIKLIEQAQQLDV